MAGNHAARWGKKGQLKEENSCYSSSMDGGRILLGNDWFYRPWDRDQVFG